MATPLQADGYRVNTEAVPQLVDFLLDAGVKGLFVGGTTGEGVLLDTEERLRLHAAAVSATGGRVPVLLHVGANRTDVAVILARQAADLEADAIAAVTPFFYGISEEGLLNYYQAIAEAAPNTPLLLYDIPHMAVNGVTPHLLAYLSGEISTLVGMKTSRHDAQMVRQLVDVAPDHYLVLAGNESVALGLLALGAHGLISGLSTAVPEPFVALTRAFAAGDTAEAQRQQRCINRILPLLPSGARIGALKTILAERGIPAGPTMPPRAMPAETFWSQIQEVVGTIS
jgi:dihydrodipicolinate synthase/N-acetylneuraminate lyase